MKVNYFGILINTLALTISCYQRTSLEASTEASTKIIANMTVNKGSTHVMVDGKMDYLITDRQVKSVSEIFGFPIFSKDDPTKDVGHYYRDSKNDQYGEDFFGPKTDATPVSIIDCLKNKVVLDLASGGGSFVRELRAKQIEAYGIDLLEPPQENQCQITNPIIQDINSSFINLSLAEGSMTEMPYKEKSFDRLISTWGPFSYFDGTMSEQEKSEQLTILSKSIVEMDRVLKDGGMALIGPIAELHYGEKLPLTAIEFAEQEIKRLNIHGLKTYRGLGRSSQSCSYCPYLIITKGDSDPHSFCERKLSTKSYLYRLIEPILINFFPN
ncbi:MAG: class I SAM-dependent methyltransferase [Oligoflexia bacterium]|nr:class I SAM-dependent methyltransferase [Oligoflexia bacterium]